jgi:hypothetical protein
VIGTAAYAQSVSTTTVQGTVYLANGQPGSGTLSVSWPAFTTTSGEAVAADQMTVTIGSDGYLSVNLAPNLGATPAGLYYTVVYYLSDGTTSTEYWVVPAAAQATLGSVRAQLMPAAQAVQAVSKAYVDEAISELTESGLTAMGGTLTGPLYLSGDPTQALQAADKHYVDESAALAVPLAGGAMTGALTGPSITSKQLGGTYQADQFSGADFGAKLQACLSSLSATNGGTCDARNFTGSQSMGSPLTISTGNATALLPCATIATANQVIVTAGTRNVALRGCALRGGSSATGSQGGTVFEYSGSGAMVQVGDPTYAQDTLGFHMDNAVINTTASTNATAHGLVAYRTQEMDLESLYFLGNSNQTGITLDGTGNYTGGTFFDNEISGFQTAVNAIGHQVANSATTDWMNASTFVRLHIDCPTSGGSPISGTYGINLQQGDGNTFTGGDVEGCSTALHLGANAQNNTIVGLRNENSINQVVADTGSSYNSWMTGGTMFTGQLTDNGTRNSFLDTFHRSFNGIKGDWYGSQQDATVTNHYRIGIGAGNERGLLDRYQTDYGYRWTMGLSDATAGEQFYQILDELNNVYRISIGQYNNGQSSTNNQTVINAAGTGAVVLNGSNNSGSGGVVIGSGGASETTVATINNAGNAQFNGTLQVSGSSTFTGSTTVKNQGDAEIDATLWAGLTTSQKESYIYKDWNGNSQWYMVKDASNNWAVNSATGGLDSFKAYQSTNSGDTYIDTSNTSGVVRINYETGSGTQFKVYGGSSGTLYASFTGTTSIQFPGLAASSGYNCLQIDNSGYITNTGSACGSGSGGGGSGTVSGQTAGYLPNASGANALTAPSHLFDNGAATGSGLPFSAPGVTDTTYPETLTSTLTSGIGGGTDECAKLDQIGTSAIGVFNGGIVARSSGASGMSTACTTPIFPASLLGSPVTPTVITAELVPGGQYTTNQEIGMCRGCVLDGNSPYRTSGNGTYIYQSATQTIPLSGSYYAYPVVVSVGPTSQTTNDFTVYTVLKNLTVSCTIPGSTGILQGYGQEGTRIENVSTTSCGIGLDMENMGGSGGNQNHGLISQVAPGISNPSATLLMLGADITAGGSYSQAPAVTITGCTTAPVYNAVMTGAAVTALQPVSYGSACPTSGVAISFATTYGSGASATPFVASEIPPVGVKDHGDGGGTFFGTYVADSASQIIPPVAFDIGVGAEYWYDTHAESVWENMVVGETGPINGAMIVQGLRLKAATNPAYANLHIYNTGGNIVYGLFATAIGSAGTGTYTLIDDQPLGGKIPSTPAFDDVQGIPLYVRNGNGVLSMNPHIATTALLMANGYYNCGPTCNSSIEPRIFVPGKNAGGFVQSMSLGDTSEPIGVVNNGGISTSDTGQVAVAYDGHVPCLTDPSVTPVPGDYVTISSNTVVSGVPVAGCLDAGSTFPTSGWVLGQWVINATLAEAGEFSIPSAPAVGSATVTPTGTGSNTITYQIVAAFDDYAQTLSPPSSALTTTTAAGSLRDNNTVTIASLPSVSGNNDYRVWRTSTSCSLPTVTAVMSPLGYLAAATLGTSSNCLFAPTVAFSGGSCSVEPAITLYDVGGAMLGYYVTNRGNCTGTPTASVTKNVMETGFIGEFVGTSFTDKGFGGDGTTPPSSGQLAPLLALNIQHGYSSASLTNPMTTAGDTIYGGISGAPTRLPLGTAGQVLTVNSGATAPQWQTPSSAPVVSYNGGDLLCAHGGDVTIGSSAITAGTATTLTVSSLQAAFFTPGTLIGITGATPSGLNTTGTSYYPVVSYSGSTLTFASLPATWTSGGTIFLGCQNTADALTSSIQYFANNTYSISSVTVGATYSQKYLTAYWSTATAASVELWLNYGSTALFQNTSTGTPGASYAGAPFDVAWDLAAPANNLMITELLAANFAAPTNQHPTYQSPRPVSGSGALKMGIGYVATGLGSITSYTSGATVTGTSGQTCLLTSFNDADTGATATATLTASNTLSGATFAVTNTGYGATAAPTTATVGNGTATCSGTGTFVTVLGGAQGNAMLLQALKTTQ